MDRPNLLILLLLMTLNFRENNGQSCLENFDFNISFPEKGSLLIVEEEIHEIQLNISLSKQDNPNCDENNILAVHTIDDQSVARIIRGKASSNGNNRNSSRHYFAIEGIFLGHTQLRISLMYNETQIANYEYKLSVVRPESSLTTIFTVLVAVFVGVNTLMYGCTLDLALVKEHIKRPVPILVGLMCQLAFMPLIAYGLIYVFNIPPILALGLFAMGCSSGGGASNQWSLLLNGDINLSIVMTFLSTMSALGTMPLWFFLLARNIGGGDVVVPYTNICISLASLLVPVVCGILVKRFLPKVAKVLVILVRPTYLVIVTFIIIFGVITNLYIFQVMASSWRIVVASLSLPYVGFLVGALVCLMFTRDWKISKTIGIETGIQNVGIAIIVMTYSFPQPDADLGIVAPVIGVSFTPFPLIIAFLSLKIRDRFCRSEKYKEESPEKDSTNEMTDMSAGKRIIKKFKSWLLAEDIN